MYTILTTYWFYFCFSIPWYFSKTFLKNLQKSFPFKHFPERTQPNATIHCCPKSVVEKKPTNWLPAAVVFHRPTGERFLCPVADWCAEVAGQMIYLLNWGLLEWPWLLLFIVFWWCFSGLLFDWSRELGFFVILKFLVFLHFFALF
jgi:hypothetical protein